MKSAQKLGDITLWEPPESKSAFATNYKGVNPKGMLFSIKHMTRLEGSYQEPLSDTLKEKLMKHENTHVVKLVDIVEQDKNLYLITEWTTSTLSKKLQAYGDVPMQELDALTVFLQILIGYKFFIENGAVFKTLGLNNILESSPEHFCLSLPSAMFRDVCAFNNVETQADDLCYFAPEVLEENSQKISEKSDIWSLGCILYRMLFGRPPFIYKVPDRFLSFSDRSRNEKYRRIGLRHYILSVGLQFPSPMNLDPIVVDLLKKMLAIDPSHRITFAELKSHPFIRYTQFLKESGTKGNRNAFTKMVFPKIENTDFDIRSLVQQWERQRTINDLSNNYQAYRQVELNRPSRKYHPTDFIGSNMNANTDPSSQTKQNQTPSQLYHNQQTPYNAYSPFVNPPQNENPTLSTVKPSRLFGSKIGMSKVNPQTSQGESKISPSSLYTPPQGDYRFQNYNQTLIREDTTSTIRQQIQPGFDPQNTNQDIGAPALRSAINPPNKDESDSMLFKVDSQIQKLSENGELLTKQSKLPEPDFAEEERKMKVIQEIKIDEIDEEIKNDMQNSYSIENFLINILKRIMLKMKLYRDLAIFRTTHIVTMRFFLIKSSVYDMISYKNKLLNEKCPFEEIPQSAWTNQRKKAKFAQFLNLVIKRETELINGMDQIYPEAEYNMSRGAIKFNKSFLEFVNDDPRHDCSPLLEIILTNFLNDFLISRIDSEKNKEKLVQLLKMGILIRLILMISQVGKYSVAPMNIEPTDVYADAEAKTEPMELRLQFHNLNQP